MERFKEILLDFLDSNIKKMFFGSILAGVIACLVWMDQNEQAVTLLIAMGGFCVSQFKVNVTKDETKPVPPPEAKQ